jgi:transcriptional regulator with XRE-family HTH domain
MTLRSNSVPAAFGQRIKRERERRGWSLRELSGKSNVATSTVIRIEKGRDTALSSALTVTAALGLSLADACAEPECIQCDGKPPPGFICSACGREKAA